MKVITASPSVDNRSEEKLRENHDDPAEEHAAGDQNGRYDHPLRAPTLIFGLSRRPRSPSGHIASGGASEEGGGAAVTQETREERTHS